MESLSLYEIAGVLGGKLINCDKDIIFKGICTNISKIRKDNLYIALVNSGYDCTNLIKTAIAKGAAAAIVPREAACELPHMVIRGTRTAFRQLCKFYRNKFNIPVIAITGSCGKTSTKDMIASVLRQRYKNVFSNPQSYNTISTIVPKILGLNSKVQAGVLEIGFSGYYGQIQRMVNIVRPSIAVITNISTGHFRYLCSKENIFKAKMEIASYLKKDNILIINGDDPFLSTIKDKPYRIIRTSLKPLIRIEKYWYLATCLRLEG